MSNRRNEEVLVAFLEEATDRLCAIESTLLRLEETGHAEPDLVHGIFRDAHSIKAGANLLDFKNIERLAHRLENILDLMRRGEVQPDGDVVTALLESVDALKELCEHLERSDVMDITHPLASLARLTGDAN